MSTMRAWWIGAGAGFALGLSIGAFVMALVCG